MRLRPAPSVTLPPTPDANGHGRSARVIGQESARGTWTWQTFQERLSLSSVRAGINVLRRHVVILCGRLVDIVIPLTVHRLLRSYAADRNLVVADPRGLNAKLGLIDGFFGHMLASCVTGHLVRAYVESRVGDGVKPQTARRELIVLRAALRLAWKEGRIAHVPWISMPPPGQSNQVILSTAEVARLHAVVAGERTVRVFVAIAVGTGARLTAICELTWSRVDFERRLIDFRAPHPRAARRKSRAVVPMSEAMLAFLKATRDEAIELGRYASSGLVIGTSASTLGRRFRNLVRAAGLPHVTPHVLRHTVATELLLSVPLVQASRYVGHKDTKITESVYGHLTAGDLSPAARALERLVPSSITGCGGESACASVKVFHG